MANKGIIYFNQRGAGCGKTYESIQILQNNNKFNDKEIFIYVTKMHSAKDVIYNELKDQERRNQLNDLKLIRDNIDGKQYTISFLNNNKKIEIIIGTIDSFNYAVVDKNKSISNPDYFKGIIDNIINGYIHLSKDNKLKYAGNIVLLNSKCLIIIDEAQDLCEKYIQAFDRLIQKTEIDIYVIGDKLQSIWGPHNIHTCIDNNTFQTNICKSDGINNVMRFHNSQFINFVNTIIDFEKYNLPKITGICNNPNCKHEDNICPYTIFQIPKIYSNEKYESKIDDTIEKIIGFMENEIDRYNYLPKNFMFIFPYLSINRFATMLESRIQEFWINKFNDKTYRETVLNNDEYWKDKINDNEFYNYIYLHKSEEGKPINLKESEHSSRILSIHASKGNGCEVVFVLGITENTLTMFSKEKNNLVYDSLLHVAITRQKRSIYVGIECNNDDIHNRFKEFNIIKDINIEPILSIENNTKFESIAEYILNNEEYFNQINDTIIEPNNYIDILPKNDNSRPVIDWGHHMIRYYVMRYYLMIGLKNFEQMKLNREQFYTIISKISNKLVSLYVYKDYINQLRTIDANNKDRKENNVIPLLLFNTNENTKYYKYTNILKNIIKHIQSKIKSTNNENGFPYLCPLECIILYYVIMILDKGSYSDISIMNIYSIIDCYDLSYDSNDNSHSECYCLCNKIFKNNSSNNINSIKESIKNHYENINHIRRLCKKYKNKWNEDTKYNIHHSVFFGEKIYNFNIIQNYDIIGYSDHSVIYFIFKPQFNKINFFYVIIEAILNNFFILHCDSNTENYTRYSNKKLYTCIITLDSDEPIILELNIDKDNPLLKQIFKDCLFNKYSLHHNYIYEFYEYCKNTKPRDEKISSIEYTLNKLVDKNLPSYIFDYFKDIHKNIKDNIKKNMHLENNIIINKLNNKDMFINDMNDKLNENLEEFLKFNNEVIDY